MSSLPRVVALAVALVAARALVAAADPKDPMGVDHFVAELADPKTAEHALTQLEALGDPAAIDGIAAAWDKTGRSPRFVAAVAALAHPLSAAEAKAKLLAPYETTGRPASWDKAVPFFARAIAAIDANDVRSRESAQLAIDALGDTNLRAAVAPLAKVAALPVDKHLVVLEVAALRALGKLTAARADVGPVLRGALAHEPPAATDREAYAMHLAVVGSALNASATLRDPAQLQAVLVAMYRNPPLFVQARRALAAFGGKSVDALRDVLRGKQPDVARAFAKYHLDKGCDETGKRCRPVAARDFYAAQVLGDLRDARAVPELVAVLGRPGLPPYFVDGDAGVTQHLAAFDALRKLGSPAAAPAIAAIVRNPKADTDDRATAIMTIAYVLDASTAKLQAQLADDIAKLALDNTASDDLRMVAVAAAGQLVASRDTAKAFAALAKRYFDEGAKRRDAFAKTHQREDELAAKEYPGYGRMFQVELGAIDLAARCGGDAKCYADALPRDADQAAAELAGDVPDVATWPAADKTKVRVVEAERALVELARRGANPAVVDAVIGRLSDGERSVRMAALMTLPHVAPAKACPTCADQLAAAAAAADGKPTLGDFAVEATILKSYYLP